MMVVAAVSDICTRERSTAAVRPNSRSRRTAPSAPAGSRNSLSFRRPVNADSHSASSSRHAESAEARRRSNCSAAPAAG